MPSTRFAPWLLAFAAVLTCATTLVRARIPPVGTPRATMAICARSTPCARMAYAQNEQFLRNIVHWLGS